MKSEYVTDGASHLRAYPVSLGPMHILQHYPLDTDGRLLAHGIVYRAQLIRVFNVHCRVRYVL